MPDSLRLMCVFAHPDDETLGTGGTLARYHAEGVEIHLVTATRGERGWFGAPEENPGLEALGRLREAELEAAARVLGISSVSFLDYVVGDLDQAPPAEASARIAHHIRRVRPHVVITFPPDGAYGHPDHIAISQFTQAAVVRAASPTFRDPQDQPPYEVPKLYYMASSEEEFKIYEQIFGELVMTIDGTDRRGVVWNDWSITTIIETGQHWRTALEAVKCHRSQIPGYDALLTLPEERLQRLWSFMPYYRVYSLVNGGRAKEFDLFEGLR
jgi:LmbE family N-acetylglucosaminyl deacetylase